MTFSLNHNRLKHGRAFENKMQKSETNATEIHKAEQACTKNTRFLASALIFLNTSSSPASNPSYAFLKFKDNNNPDKAIVKQEKGCSDLLKHVMAVYSIFLLA